MNKGRERGFITGVNDRWDKRKHQGPTLKSQFLYDFMLQKVKFYDLKFHVFIN